MNITAKIIQKKTTCMYVNNHSMNLVQDNDQLTKIKSDHFLRIAINLQTAIVQLKQKLNSEFIQ